MAAPTVIPGLLCAALLSSLRGSTQNIRIALAAEDRANLASRGCARRPLG